MDIGSLSLGAALLVLVVLFLARPFLRSSARFGRRKTLRQELLAQKEAILAQIRALEFDYETGTMPEADYQQQRQQMVAEAAEILKKLDALPGVTEPVPSRGLDSEIEKAVANLRRPKPGPRPAAPAPAKAKSVPQSSSPAPATAKKPRPTNGRINFCPQCGQPVEEGDNFCAYCGHKIVHPQTT